MMMTQSDLEAFEQSGFVVMRGLADSALCSRIQQAVNQTLYPPLGPLEYEVEVQYPGAPRTFEDAGGFTPRRLLNAYSRGEAFRECAAHPKIVALLKELLKSEDILVSQNHHNCIMTKHPGFSSATLWHQDQRYWSFDRPDLVSAWLALGVEHEQNGGLRVLPGTHKMDFDRGQFDASLFLREDLEQNQQLIDTAVSVELNAGDLLLFHSRTLHAAGQNQTDSVKTSLVFTYHSAENKPIPHTRSAKLLDIKVS